MSLIDFRYFTKTYGLSDDQKIFTRVTSIVRPSIPLACLRYLWTLLIWKEEIEKHKSNVFMLQIVKNILGNKHIHVDLPVLRITRLLKIFSRKIAYTMPYKYFFRYLDGMAQQQHATFAYILIMSFPVTIGIPNMIFDDDPILFEKTLKSDEVQQEYIDKILKILI